MHTDLVDRLFRVRLVNAKKKMADKNERGTKKNHTYGSPAHLIILIIRSNYGGAK